jgi:hypothetical protein
VWVTPFFGVIQAVRECSIPNGGTFHGQFTAGEGKVPKTVSGDFETVAGSWMVKYSCVGGRMGGHIAQSWTDILTEVLIYGALIGVAFFSFRYMIRFRQQVKQNRASGVYDDLEFKRRISLLNIMRYSLIATDMLLGAAAIWAIGVRIPIWVWFPIWGIIFIVVLIWGSVVEYRWRMLMTKGIT